MLIRLSVRLDSTQGKSPNQSVKHWLEFGLLRFMVPNISGPDPRLSTEHKQSEQSKINCLTYTRRTSNEESMHQSLLEHCSNVSHYTLYVLTDWSTGQQGSSGFNFDSRPG